MASTRLRRLLVAGGAGFLGSAFVRDRLRADPEVAITVVDRLARPEAERDLADLLDDRRFRLVRGELRDRVLVQELAGATEATVNFASEEFTADSGDPAAFARTEVEGTAVLLDAARKYRHQRFLLVSSADVYAPVTTRPLREDDIVAPGTMASTFRASAEMLVRAYATIHSQPILITRGVVAYGPQQPLTQPVARMITSALEGKPVLVDGKGSVERDYLHVDEHVAAIARVLWKGDPGGIYNIGTGSAISGGNLAELILQLCGKPASLKHVTSDGPRGSWMVDARRMRPLGWEPRMPLREGLRQTVEWYRQHEDWWKTFSANAA
jgi:dTDP-glucose 4,6-dehydratase